MDLHEQQPQHTTGTPNSSSRKKRKSIATTTKTNGNTGNPVKHTVHHYRAPTTRARIPIPSSFTESVIDVHVPYRNCHPTTRFVPVTQQLPLQTVQPNHYDNASATTSQYKTTRNCDANSVGSSINDGSTNSDHRRITIQQLPVTTADDESINQQKKHTNHLLHDQVNARSITSVEDRVRARSLLMQQQQEQQQGATSTTTITDTSNAATSMTTTTIDPHFILRITDALWMYLITTNFRQKQQQQHPGSISSSSIFNDRKQTLPPSSKNNYKPEFDTTAVLMDKKNALVHQNFALKDIVQTLRQMILSNVTQGGIHDGTTSTSRSSNNGSSSKASKREVVDALLEIHANGNTIYENWITLFDPNTMDRISEREEQQSNNGSIQQLQQLQPNTIVQINHSISYQTVRTNILSIIASQEL